MRSFAPGGPGGLGGATLELEEDGFLPFEIERAEFESTWERTRALNRKH